MSSHPDAADLAKLRDPLAARLSRRVLEGQIHILEAQIAQLTEVMRKLGEQEERIASDSSGAREGEPEQAPERRTE
ncbi:MAG: hypothetical protein M3312_07135 [Actinomycetota bacterium]|nr:hypothetical protein [Actinomycetota bacterium]